MYIAKGIIRLAFVTFLVFLNSPENGLFTAIFPYWSQHLQIGPGLQLFNVFIKFLWLYWARLLHRERLKLYKGPKYKIMLRLLICRIIDSLSIMRNTRDSGCIFSRLVTRSSRFKDHCYANQNHI